MLVHNIKMHPGKKGWGVVDWIGLDVGYRLNDRRIYFDSFQLRACRAPSPEDS
jgi:hypothetical protein